MAFQLNLSAWAEGGTVPTLHTCDGANISPAVEWSGEPAGTQSFVLIMDDPDAPDGTWNHWVLYDLSPSVHVLAQGYKAGHLGARSDLATATRFRRSLTRRTGRVRGRVRRLLS